MAFSSARAALRRCGIARLPSWHAYSRTASSSLRVSGIANVHGLVHVVASSTVKDHSSLSALVTVKRSMNRTVSGFAPR
jgi:hypothetical protein